MNWRGRPLTSHEVIVNTIAATTTSRGLQVRAVLDEADYPTGVKIGDKQMRQLADDGRWERHDWHGEWNYTLHPQPTQVDVSGADGGGAPRADTTAERVA